MTIQVNLRAPRPCGLTIGAACIGLGPVVFAAPQAYQEEVSFVFGGGGG